MARAITCTDNIKLGEKKMEIKSTKRLCTVHGNNLQERRHRRRRRR